MNADGEEFTAYVHARSAALLRIGWLLTGNGRDAEDLVQTALLKTLRHWRRIRNRGALDSFVRQVMVNEQRAWFRRASSRELPHAEIPAEHSDDQTGRVDELDRLGHALMQLPARQRAAVVFRFYEDLSEAETARILGCSTGNVKSLTSRGVARLREVMGNDDREGSDHELRR